MAGGFFASFPSGGGGGVTSLDGMTGALTLVAGTGISIVNGVGTITISSTGSSGITSINGDTTAAQTLTTGTAGTNFTIVNDGVGTHTFNLPTASATNRGALSSADWSTFNAKQPAGNYITALTGDGTATGPGSAVLTLATVNGNVGSFGTATAVSHITVNAKGLITAASNTAIQITEAQVTNLTTDLASKANVTLSNLTSPTAINQDLIFNQAGASTLTTKNQTATSSNNLFVQTGNTSAATSTTGVLTLRSGVATNTSSSGAVILTSGISDAQTGDTVILTGDPSTANTNSGAISLASGSVTGTGVSGAVNIQTGNSDTQNSGNISLTTGQPASPDAGSGAIFILTSPTTGTGSSGSMLTATGSTVDAPSGTFSLSTGSTSGTGNSGAISIVTGNTSGNGTTGLMLITSGNVNTGGASSGSLQITTGATDVGTTGNIVIAPGAPTGAGSRGFITLDGLVFLDAAQRIASRITTGDVTIDSRNDYAILLNDATAGAFNINLPAGVQGMTFKFAFTAAACAAATDYTFVPNGGDTIDPSADIAGNILPSFNGTGTPVVPIMTLVFNSGVWYQI